MENIQLLASVAHDSGSYEESYKYQTKILEMNASDADAWVKKGVAAAFLTTSQSMKGREAKNCILKGIELGASDSTKATALTALREAYNAQFNRINDELRQNILDHQKISMPAGGSALLHMAGQSLNKIIAGRALAPARIDGVELIVAMCAIKPTQETYRLGVVAINNLIEHAKQNGDYLKNTNDALPQIKVISIRESLLKEAETKYPGFKASTQQPLNQSKKEGCFIATAAAGDYNHPQVVILRILRDNFIMSYSWGRLFVWAYYKISPSIASLIEKSPITQVMVMRFFVSPISRAASKFILSKYHSK